MSKLSNINLKINVSLEFMYSLFALGTDKHHFKMIQEFDLEPNDKIIEIIKSMKKSLSRYLEGEISYFFDLSGLGYILYKYILMHPEVDEIGELLNIIGEIDAKDLAFKITTSVCKNHIPNENTKEYMILKDSTNEMMKLVEQVNFQDSQRRERVIEILENPEETKQRFILVLRQYYNCCYSKFENDIITIINSKRAKYDKMLMENPSEFLKKYLNYDGENKINTSIHLSFFKYISWHHYSIYSNKFDDWFILGIYSDMLFEQDLSVEKYSNFFKALSDPNRIQILKLLSERSWFGQEIAEQLNITPATVSYHMTFMQKIGVVTFVRADNRSYYTLNNSSLLKYFNEITNYFS